MRIGTSQAHFILHPSSFSLHPSSFSLHPSSFSLHPSSFLKVREEGVEPSFSGSEPDGLPVSRFPNVCKAASGRVRGEGFEPSSPGSKPGSLPLADPRECPVGVEPTSGSLEDCRLCRSAKGTCKAANG